MSSNRTRHDFASLFRITMGIALLTSSASADLNILAIGDSLTSGKNYDNVERSSYRPYLDQSIRNYQGVTTSSSHVDVNWIGSNSGTAFTPDAITVSSDDPIIVTNFATQDQHQAVAGVSSSGYVNNYLSDAVTAINATSSSDSNLALILLGTNDFFMYRTAEPTAGSTSDAWGWNSNRHNPLGVIDSIQSIAQTLYQADPDIEILVSAIPPFASGAQYDNSAVGNRGNLWTESQRLCNAGATCNGPTDPTTNLAHQDLVRWDGSKFVRGGGTDVGGPRDATSNDIIQVINDELEAWANETADPDNPGPDVKFVNPLDSAGGYQLMGPSAAVSVDSGDHFKLDEIDPDGIHLTKIGDQFYASGFWEQGVRAALNTTAAAQPVPEPSSFLFLGLVTSFMIGFQWLRRRKSDGES